MASRSIFAALPSSIAGSSSSKVGRPAKAGERYPSGKLKPAGLPPAQVRRIVDLAKAKASDPILATSLGWLRLHDVLTDTHVAAGIAYAQMKGRYDQVMGVPSRTAKSPSYQMGLGHAPPAETEDHVKQAAKVRRQYAAMLDCLGNAKQRELLDRVCVDDEQPTAWDLTELTAALRLLAVHMKLQR